MGRRHRERQKPSPPRAIELVGKSDEDLAAKTVERHTANDQGRYQERQHDERCAATAGKDPIVHLHAIDWQGELEQVQDQAEANEHNEGAARAAWKEGHYLGKGTLRGDLRIALALMKPPEL
jgi:hypothetical protein